MAERPEDIGLDSKDRAERDRIDLNHEMAGDDTGRIKRFLSEGTTSYTSDSKEKKAERRTQSLLHMLLAEDPQYAALYKSVTEKLEKARQAVDQALIDINQRLETSERELQNMRDQAAEREDGMKVFRSSLDGGIYTEDGQRLSDEEAQEISIPEDAPSWEDYSAEKEARDQAARQREDVERYQREVLNPIEERMRDPNNVFTKDELEEIDRSFGDDIPPVIRTHYDSDPTPEPVSSSSASAAHDMVEETDISSAPEMGKAFELASADIPDFGSAPEPAPGQHLTRAPC